MAVLVLQEFFLLVRKNTDELVGLVTALLFYLADGMDVVPAEVIGSLGTTDMSFTANPHVLIDDERLLLDRLLSDLVAHSWSEGHANDDYNADAEKAFDRPL